MTRTRASFCCVLMTAMVGCGSADPTAIKAGIGIKLDAATQTVSIDDAVVPTSANCASGQVVQRTASGWMCSAAAPDATQLGGKPAAAYLTSDATASNATRLEGYAASYFLPAAAKAADSAMLNGHTEADFLAAAGTAANSSRLNGHTDADFLRVAATAANASALNGHPDSYFLTATSTAANSAQLNGQPSSFYLPAAGTAANSARLNGQSASFYLAATDTAANAAKLGNQPPSYYLAASGTAADSSQLGGVAPASYARADQPASMKGTLTIQNSSDSGFISLGGGTTGLFGSNVAGNFHLDADSGKSDGRIYLNWFEGNGVRFGNGAQNTVAEMDPSGNLSVDGTIAAKGAVSAASFNGLQIFLAQVTLTSVLSCKDVCLNNGGSCLAAKATINTTTAVAQCTDPLPSGWSLKCYCAKF